MLSDADKVRILRDTLRDVRGWVQAYYLGENTSPPDVVLSKIQRVLQQTGKSRKTVIKGRSGMFDDDGEKPAKPGHGAKHG